jgi:hypothetical protein
VNTFIYWLRFHGWLLKQLLCFALYVLIYVASWLIAFGVILTKPWMTYSTKQWWLDLLTNVTIAGRAWQRRKEKSPDPGEEWKQL